MIKNFSSAGFLALAAVALLTNPTVSKAADILNTGGADGAGKPIVEIGDPTFKFQPSPQVLMVGETDEKAFSVAAAHTSVFEKENGEAYAMTSEASGLFVMKPVTAAVDVKIGTDPGLLDGDYKLPDGTTFTTFPTAGGGGGGGDE